ncbi:MAG: hypothetical protein KF764_33080 [Labilithrix sp.]|nr:hypothetical protein [Labilithrix sp.]MBX3219585.1 hypothetical protein [Labilithrix sp.]
MRWLAIFTSSIAIAGSGLACGRVLDDADGATARNAADAAGGADAAGDSPIDGGAPDEGDAPVDGSTCRPRVVEGFETSGWLTGWEVDTSSAKVSLVAQPHTGAAALQVELTGSDGFARVSRTPTGACPLTIDFWMMRMAASNARIVALELMADDRIMHLVLENDRLSVDRTNGDPVLLSASFAVRSWHHIRIRYELSGAMVVTADATQVPLDPTDSLLVPATRLAFGVLGSSAIDVAESTLRFDDVTVE